MKINAIKKLYENGEAYSENNIFFKNKVDAYVEEAIFSMIENESNKLKAVQKYINLAKKNIQMLVDMLEINKNMTFNENLSYVKSALEIMTNVEENNQTQKNLNVKNKYSDIKMVLGLIVMLLMFFAFNHFEQKNNVETIQILNYENQQLKKGLSPQINYLQVEKKLLESKVKKLNKENGYLHQDIKNLEKSNQKLINKITLLGAKK